MKIKITLLTVILTVFGLNIYSQVFPNTTWKLVDPCDGYDEYIHFGTDTVFHSNNNTTYTKRSVYEESGNNFSIVDLPPNVYCPVSDTGHYTFLMDDDEMKFTLVYDSCKYRIGIMVVREWFPLSSSVFEPANPLSGIEIYPIPAIEIVNLQSAVFSQELAVVEIYDLNGRKLIEKRFPAGSENLDMDLSSVENGIYLCKVSTEKYSTTKNLIIQK